MAVFRCGDCGTRMLAPDYQPPADARALDEPSRFAALAALRTVSARRVLDRLESLGLGPHAHLLDVGCSYGWFLLEAARRGWKASGIDPDAPCVAHARRSGCAVTVGLFPDDLEDRGPYDAVTFNDVFEHLRDPAATLEACRPILAPSGVVVLNLPSTRGLLFRLAEALCGVGWRAPLARLFQIGFPSPHYYYYSPEAIRRLASQADFGIVTRHSLPALTWGAVRARVAMDRGQTGARAAVTMLALTALLPVLRTASAADFEVFYLRASGLHPKGRSSVQPAAPGARA